MGNAVVHELEPGFLLKLRREAGRKDDTPSNETRLCIEVFYLEDGLSDRVHSPSSTVARLNHVLQNSRVQLDRLPLAELGRYINHRAIIYIGRRLFFLTVTRVWCPTNLLNALKC